MSGEAKKPIDKELLWGGGRSPFSISYGKLMMWYFLVSDALTFGGLLVAYGASRHAVTMPWPIGEQTFDALPGLEGSYPLIYVALMTFILIVSSVTMVLAVEAGHRNHKPGVVKWLGYTIIGGAFFVGSQAWEWSHFIHGSFQTDKDVSVVVTNHRTQQEETVVLPAGSFVYLESHFGHDYEHAMEMVEDEMIGVVGHDSHADAHHSDAHESHAESAEETHSDPHEFLAHAKPELLVLNKYTEGKAIAHAGEALKLWDAMESGTMMFGANLKRNEYGPQQYADCFFFITGFHGFHVFSGVLINIIVWIMVIKGVFERRKHYEMVEKIGLYWHFVDLVWVFVFTFFYLV
jgi:cytochrome c oxidase subunit III